MVLRHSISREQTCRPLSLIEKITKSACYVHSHFRMARVAIKNSPADLSDPKALGMYSRREVQTVWRTSQLICFLLLSASHSTPICSQNYKMSSSSCCRSTLATSRVSFLRDSMHVLLTLLPHSLKMISIGLHTWIKKASVESMHLLSLPHLNRQRWYT